MTFYICMHNSEREGETPSFKLEKLFQLDFTPQDCGHLFRIVVEKIENLVKAKEMICQ